MNININIYIKSRQDRLNLKLAMNASITAYNANKRFNHHSNSDASPVSSLELKDGPYSYTPNMLTTIINSYRTSCSFINTKYGK